MELSLTFVGLGVLLLSMFLKSAGIEVEQGSIAVFVDVLLKIIGSGLVWYGRFRKGDITWFGAKIDSN